MINNESVTRRDGEDLLSGSIEDLRAKQSKDVKELLENIEKSTKFINVENQDLRRKIERVSKEFEGVGVKINNVTETTRVSPKKTQRIQNPFWRFCG